jgi:hypothetical protein
VLIHVLLQAAFSNQKQTLVMFLGAIAALVNAD